MLHVWIPHAEGVPLLGDLPGDIRLSVFDGAGERPGDIEKVEFCVPARPGPAMIEAIAAMPRLKVLQTLSAGVERFRPAAGPGVTLCNARGAQSGAVAEWVAAAVLSSVRDLPGFAAAQAARRWDQRRTGTLDGATVLIAGYGTIGAAVERRLAPFGPRFLRVARRAREGVAPIAELPGLIGAADVVVALLPRTEETHRLFDAALLARMRDGALFVNAGRGDTADTGALLAEARAGRLRAALDVTDPEPPPPDHPLWTAPGVVVTPHVAGLTPAFLPNAYRLVRAQLERHLAGRPLENVVSAEY